MAQQVINIGVVPNDGAGDALRVALDKTNTNFQELYAAGAATSVQPARLVSAGTGLTGGGSLATDRTLALSAGTLASLAKADTALQNAAAFATAVQGGKADSALQPGDTATPSNGSVTPVKLVDGIMPFDSIALFEAATINASITNVRTAGYYAPGDGGGATYVRLASAPSPVKPWHKQSADGAWWSLKSNSVTASAFGAAASMPEGAARISAAIAYLYSIGGGELIIDTLCKIDAPITLPNIGGDPYGSRVWSTNVVVKGRGPGTGIKAAATFPANTVMMQMPFPITFDEMLIDGSSIPGVIGFNQTYVTGYARSYFYRLHFIGFDNVNAKCYRTTGHTASFINCNFERAWSAIWVDNYAIGITIIGCLFNANGIADTYGPSFAQIYFGMNTKDGIPQGVMLSDNQFTGYGYAILMRAMYVAFIGNNVFDMSAPGGQNECVRLEPQTFVDVNTGNTVQMVCSEIDFHNNWFGAGYPVAGANPPFNTPRGYSIRVKDWCHDIMLRGNQFPQSQPVLFISANVGQDGVGNANGAIYNVIINDNIFTDMLGSGTMLMLYCQKVSNLYVGPGNLWRWCTLATDGCADQVIDVPALQRQGKTAPVTTNSVGSLNEWASYTPLPSASVPGETPPVWGGCTGRYRREGSTMHVSLRVPVVTPGTGSGSVRITNMPGNARTDTVLTGIEEGSGIMCKLFIAATTNVGVISFYDGAYPSGVAGRTLCINGCYEYL